MRKFTALLMAIIMVLGSVNFAFAADTPEEAMKEARIYAKGDYYGYFTYHGSPIKTKIDYHEYSNKGVIEQFPAYCIDPRYDGASEIGSYTVDVQTKVTDEKVWGIITNGYPYKTPAELGLQTEEQAYYATKMALWMYLEYKDLPYWKVTNSSFDYIMTATKKIYENGMKVTAIKEPVFTTTAETATAIPDTLDSKYLSQVYSVSADVEIKDYTVKLDGNIPTGAKITDLDNKDKTIFNPGDKFKVLIPLDSFDVSGNFDFFITGQIKNNAILYGLTAIPKTQNYAVIKDPYDFMDAKATVTFSKAPKDTGGKLQIIKIEDGTTNRLAGATFRVSDATGGIIGVFTTDGNGQVTIPVAKLGAYYAEEITAPKGFEIDITPHKDIVVTADFDAIMTFSNKKKPKLEILKVDSETGATLSNAVIRVSADGGHETHDVVTNSQGIAVLEDLEYGKTYSVVEIVAPPNYTLDSTPQITKLTSGTNKIVMKNSKKPGLLLKKFDEDTGLPLGLAEFSVSKKGGQVLWEGIIPNSGEILLENLPEGWLTVTELAAPKGYLKTWESKDVFLESGKVVELKFDNRRRPSLELIKLDSKGLPLEGVLFKAIKTEDKTVSEYITDSSGRIEIIDLDEAIYTVEEIKTLDTHILDPQHKDIFLEWGKQKTLVFTNAEKPKLEIYKHDKLSKEPLMNFGFRVTKTEDKTVSEYYTDPQGKILIENLDEGVYTVEEFLADSKYILDPQKKEIALVADTTKKLIFENIKKPTLTLLKTNALTEKPIPNTRYKIEYENPNGGTELLGNFKTDANGYITIPFVNVGWYVLTETHPAQGMQLPSNPIKRIYLAPGQNSYLSGIPTENGNSETENNGTGNNNAGTAAPIVTYGDDYAGEEAINYPLNSIVIKKSNSIDGRLLAGATFEVRRVTDSVSGTSGTIIGTYTTNHSGIIVLTGLESGGFIVEEVKSPVNFTLKENNSQQTWLKADGTSIVELSFSNDPYGHLLISKKDNKGNPLPNAVFKVTNAKGEVIGNSNGEYTSDENGEILISNIKPQSLIVTEIKAPTNYRLDKTPQSTYITANGETKKLTFVNYPHNSLLILKKSTTGEPLPNAVFKVTNAKGEVIGNSNGEYTSDENGEILISNIEPQSLIVTEIKAPANYQIDKTPQTIDITADGEIQKLTFINAPQNGLLILKKSTKGEPLPNAVFKVTNAKGEVIGNSNGEYTSDENGEILISNIEPQSLIVTEIKAPKNYQIDKTPQTIDITADGEIQKLTFINAPQNGLLILKKSTKGEPLPNAVFKVTNAKGEVIGNSNGEYTSDENGEILISNIEPQSLIVTEIKAPANYQIDKTPQTIDITADGEIQKLTFINTPYAQLTILKIDSETRNPIPNVTFSLTKINGERIGTTYKTNESGLIFINGLDSEHYILTELETDEHHILDSTPLAIEVKPDKPLYLEIKNNPIPSLVITKKDFQSKKTLEGVTIEVRKENGELISTEKTDRNGRIYLNVDSGKYIVTEKECLPGYELDKTPGEINVVKGKQATVELLNKKLAGLRVLKIDSVTKKPIFNVEFRIYDFETNKEIAGPFYSDNNGVVDFSGVIKEGRYKIVETRPADGYLRDDIPKTVDFKSGVLTEIRWENQPQMGQIQVTKKSADDNEQNGLPKGTLLEGAVFELYNSETGNLIDRFISGKDGRAVSKPLPLGEYSLKEVKAPNFYKKNDEVLTIKIKYVGEIVKVEFTNEAANTGVYIKKTGNVEAMTGDTIRYDFKAIQNTSTVPLTDFFFRDVIPTDAVRLTKISTGTFNQSLKYKIMITTNKGDTRVIADNLQTTINNVVDCSNASLGLRSDEYVTSFSFVFGNVKAGFCQVENPFIFVKVLDSLPNGYQFANRSDIGGKYQNEWVIANSTWLTTVYSSKGKLPKTGY